MVCGLEEGLEMLIGADLLRLSLMAFLSYYWLDILLLYIVEKRREKLKTDFGSKNANVIKI